jgi:transcriptional regulator with PAS, ATPase and Fis domain
MAIWWLTAGAPSRYQVLEEERAIIGRGPDVTVTFDAASVSRCHVEIYRQGPAYIAHDFGSTNGTHVNGRPVEYSALSEGDVLRLGDVLGVVMRVAADVPPDAPEVETLGPDIAFGPGLHTQVGQIRRVGPSDLPVVVVGETGAGKEYVAQAIHLLSGRRGSFHPVNCAALPTALAEAELFGHAKGAFTGADQAGLGHVRAANGGTLFLDELPELTAPVQAKLLRVLQDRQVTRLGETRADVVDLRVVAACQQPLEELVASGRVRRDLAARIAGLTVVVPPLRQRRADIGVFFRRFLDHYAAGSPPSVDPRLLEALLLYHWPGNLRELDLLTRRLLALHGNEPILLLSFLPPEIGDRVPVPDQPARVQPPGRGEHATTADRDQHDSQRLADELRRHAGNISRAAAAAGISRSRAYRLMADRPVEKFLAEIDRQRAIR